MFDVGEFVVYGNEGVCKVDQVGPINMDGARKERIYYTLVPVYSKGSKVFTPVDNCNIIIRPIITEDEANKLIENITSIDALWVNDDKKREESYKSAIKQCDVREYVRIIKSLYEKKQIRIAEGKKTSTSDDRYLKLAENFLYGELAVALGIEREEVEEYITKKIESQEVQGQIIL